MSKKLIILTISIVVAISISIGVYIVVSGDSVGNSEPEWKKIEAQEKKVGVNRDNILLSPRR